MYTVVAGKASRFWLPADGGGGGGVPGVGAGG